MKKQRLSYNGLLGLIDRLSRKSMTSYEILEFLGYDYRKNYPLFYKIKGVLGDSLVTDNPDQGRTKFYSVIDTDKAKEMAETWSKSKSNKSKGPIKVKEEERKLTPLTDESQLKHTLEIIDCIYQSNSGMSVNDIKVSSNHKLTRNYISSRLSYLTTKYPEFIDMNEGIYTIRDYRGLIRSLNPKLEFLNLVILVENGFEVTSSLSGMSDAYIKKGMEVGGYVSYEISAPNSKRLWTTLSLLRAYGGMRILHPSELEEKLDSKIKELLDKSGFILR